MITPAMREPMQRRARGAAAGQRGGRLAGGRLPGDQLLAAAEALLLVGLAFAIAHLGWTLVTPVTPFGVPVAAPRPIADPAALGSFDPFFRSRSDAGASQVSTLDLKLVGTRVDTVSGRGAAIIAASSAPQTSFSVGETILPGVTLAAVGFDSATIDRGGRREQLFIDQSAGTAPVTPESSGLAKAAAPRLAADIALTPRLRGTAITGFSLDPKGSGTAFAAAGLQPGDVLTAVDGVPVARLGDPAGVARRLDSGGVTATIERGGKALTLRITDR